MVPQTTLSRLANDRDDAFSSSLAEDETMTLRYRLRTLLIAISLVGIVAAAYTYRWQYIRDQRRPWVGSWKVRIDGEPVLGFEFTEDGYVIGTKGPPVRYTIDGPNQMTIHLPDGSRSRCYFHRGENWVSMSQAKPGDPFPTNVESPKDGVAYTLERVLSVDEVNR